MEVLLKFFGNDSDFDREVNIAGSFQNHSPGMWRTHQNIWGLSFTIMIKTPMEVCHPYENFKQFDDGSDELWTSLIGIPQIHNSKTVIVALSCIPFLSLDTKHHQFR